MNKVIPFLLIGLVVLGAYKLWEYYEAEANKKDPLEQSVERKYAGGVLPGMDPSINGEYTEAKNRGPAALRLFIQRHMNTGRLVDPRLADIQLDYVLLVSLTNPQEAKAVYLDVSKRIKPESPVFRRVRDLQKTFR